MLTGYKLEQVHCPKTAAKNQIDWQSVTFVDDDWDTEAKILILNEEDAKYSGLTLDELLTKLS